MIVTRDGLYGDVLWRGDELITVRQRANGVVVCEADGVVEWSRSVVEHNHLMFLTGIVGPDGEVYATGKTNTPGLAMVLGRRFKTLLPSGQGNFPSQLAIVNGRVVVFVVHDAMTYRMYSTNGDLLAVVPLPPHRTGTSQGIRFIGDDGAIVWGDDTTGKEIEGRLLHEWVRRGIWTAGQGNSGGVGIMPANFTALPGPAFFPRLAVNGDKVAVLKVDSGNIFYDVFTPPYPVDAPVVVPPPVVVTPPPPPPSSPPIKDPPVSNDNGIVNGVLVDPRANFMFLVQGSSANDYARVLSGIESALKRHGIGTMRDSVTYNDGKGTPRGRIYLPTAQCPNAAPRADDADAIFFGVPRVEACWGLEVQVIADDGNGGLKWAWFPTRGRLEDYTPVITGTIVPPPVPPPVPPSVPPPASPPPVDNGPVITRLDSILDALERQAQVLQVLVMRDAPDATLTDRFLSDFADLRTEVNEIHGQLQRGFLVNVFGRPQKIHPAPKPK